MNNYNLRLSELRENAGLSLKEASKALKISKWKIYLYENGYFRPTKKDLKKFKDFYKEEISLEGDDAYPAPTKEKVLKKEKEALKVKRIVFGSLSGAILLAIIAGTILFNQSVNNTKSYYGETYNETRDKVNELGEIGYDIATSLKYHMVSEHESGEATFIFFETDNLLYFNECSYSTTILNEEWDLIDYIINLALILALVRIVAISNMVASIMVNISHVALTTLVERQTPFITSNISFKMARIQLMNLKLSN